MSHNYHTVTHVTNISFKMVMSKKNIQFESNNCVVSAGLSQDLDTIVTGNKQDIRRSSCKQTICYNTGKFI